MVMVILVILVLMVLLLMAARSFPVVAGRRSLRCQTPYYHQPPAFPTGLTGNSPPPPGPTLPTLASSERHSIPQTLVLLMVSSTALAIPVYRHTAIQRQKRVTAKGEYCSYAFLPLDGSTDGRSALPSRPTPAGCPIPLCDAQSRSRCVCRRLNAPRGHRPAPGSRVVCMFEHRDAPQPRYRAVAVAAAGARRGAVMYRRHRRSSSPSAAGTAQPVVTSPALLRATPTPVPGQRRGQTGGGARAGRDNVGHRVRLHTQD